MTGHESGDDMIVVAQPKKFRRSFEIDVSFLEVVSKQCREYTVGRLIKLVADRRCFFVLPFCCSSKQDPTYY
jgi:hypothetical protein